MRPMRSAERQRGVSHHKRSRTMTFSRIALIAVAAFAMAPGVGPAFAADDAARIKQCVADNQGEGQTATVVAAYCSCMSKKMSASETQSITTWENSHSSEQKACSEEAGAKSNK
jgi:anti-sigma factor RsiW